VSKCEQCKSFYLELERLRRLVPTGSYTLNVAHEEEIQRLTKERDEARANYAFMVERAANEKLDGYRELAAKAAAAENARDKAQAKAADYERDWYEAKSEFGSAMAKMREALRAAEQRELSALAELDEATVKLGTLAKLLVAHGCDCSEMSSNFDCERCFACKVSDALGDLVA
jgi:hypothetical protein